MNTDYSLVLAYCYPGKVWSMSDFDYDTLEWMDESKKPTRAELDGLWQTTQDKIKAESDLAANVLKSAEAKLQKLGLTVDEVKAIISSN